MRSLTLVCILTIMTLVILDRPTVTQSALAMVRFKARPRQSLIPSPKKERTSTQLIRAFSQWILEIKEGLAKHWKPETEDQKLALLRLARLYG